MARNLPVRIIAARDKDYAKPEPGGPRNDPPWVLTGDALRNHSHELVEKSEAIVSTFKNRSVKKNPTPAVLKVKMRAGAEAKTHRFPVEELLNLPQNKNVIGVIGDYDLVLKVDSDHDLAIIREKLNDTAKYTTALSTVLSLDTFAPSVELPSEKGATLKIKLHNFKRRELNEAALAYFESSCAKLNLEPVVHHYTEELTVYSLNGWTPEIIPQLTETGAVFSIAPMPVYARLDEATQGAIIIPPFAFDSNGDYPTLGVLDSGIAPIPQLRDWLLSEKYSSYDEAEIDRRHGTFVAGRALYPDVLHGKTLVGVGGIKLLDAIVFPGTQPTIEEPDLIANITEAVATYPDTPVWLMAISLIRECELDRFSDLAKVLDDLQDIYSTIFVKSAGNTGSFVNGAPRERIFESDDSIRSLVVGSIASEASPGDLAEINHASPFSPTGYGPAKTVSPILVHFGGNARVENGGIIGTGVPSFSTDGTLNSRCGTSFSAPLVAALIAGLHHKIEDANPLLLKALAIHNAKYPESLKYSSEDRLRLMGFGVPPPIDEILYNDENEITLIYKDALADGRWRQFLEFPYSKDMIRDGKYYGEITATLVTDPILDGDQGVEYCQTDIDVKLGTYSEVVTRQVGGRVINPRDRIDGQNLLLPRFLSRKRGPNEHGSLFHDDAFQPIKKWITNLSDFTAAPSEHFLGQNRLWFLELRASYRVNAQILTQTRPNVDFCLIITIRDPEKKGTLYTEIYKFLEQNNYVHSGIKLRSVVKVGVSNPIF